MNMASELPKDSQPEPIDRSRHNLERIIMKLAGIILIVVGVLALVYQGFTYTKTEKDAQLGPIEIQHQETHTVPLPPIIGGVCIVGGVLALGLGASGKV
jgi:hypothetical protein